MRNFIFIVLCASIALFLYGTAYADEPGDALAEEYRAAHDAGDVDALKALVYWEDSVEITREGITERLTRHIGRNVEDIKFQGLSGDEEFVVGGYEPNLTPVGYLVVEFEHDQYETRLFSVFYVVGELDGRYMITVAKHEY